MLIHPTLAQGAQIGWVPQQRPASLAADPQGTDPTSFDWTGLTEELHNTDGSSTNDTSYFGNNSAYSVELSVDDQAELFRGSWTLSGTSTFKWLWAPPANLQGVHNDPNKPANDPSQPFPAPNLFALGVTIPYVEGSYATSATPCTASGNVKDGFDSSWNPSFDLLNSSSAAAPASSTDSAGNFINELPRYRVLPATLESDQKTTHVTLSPFAHVEASTNSGTGNGYGYGYVSEGASIIGMYYPNPYVRPDLGDFSYGTGETGNQFVYGTQMPGVLTVPAQIGVFGAYEEDVDWLVKPSTKNGPLVNWQFDALQSQSLPIPGEQSYNVTRQIIANEDIIAPDTSTAGTNSQTSPAIGFVGLPSDNVGFGTHPVTMAVKTYDPASKVMTVNSSQTAYIQTFFPGAQSNFPASVGLYSGDRSVQTAPQPYSVPNWYYYYTQVDNIAQRYSASIHYEAGQGAHQGRSFALDDPSNNYPIEIHDDFYGDRTNIHLFDTNPEIDPNTGTHLVRYIGDLEVKGLFDFIYGVGHESGHVLTYTTPDDTQPSGIVVPIWTTAINNDADQDKLSDSWELHHHLNPMASDTTGAYSSFPDDAAIGDAQLTADLNGVKELFAYMHSLQEGSNPQITPQDWSDGGWNYSGTALPYFTQERYNNDASSLTSGRPPVFYFKFTPVIQPYGPGQPVLASDRRYEIRDVSDLQALYPRLVIGLTGLTYENPVTP